MAIIKLDILSTTKFPLSYSRGNEASRFKKSRQLSEKFLKELEKKTTEYNDEFILNSIQKVLKPYNIRVTIESNKLDTRGGHRTDLKVAGTSGNEVNCNLCGHILCFDPDPQKREKYTVLHEAGHVFDDALNPKTLRCDYLKLYGKDEIYNTYLDVRNRFFHISDMKELKEFTTKSLAEIPDEYAIDTLQNIRNTLKTEINQYRFTLKKMILDKNIDLVTLINEINLYFSLKFEQKLKFANKLLKERLENRV